MTPSNTSGSKVANIGYWPKGLIQYLVAGLKVIYETLKRVLTGELQLLAVDFIAQSGSDVLPDPVMEEITRRLVVTLEKEAQGNVVFSPSPPDDKSKVWWQTDPATSSPIGSPKLWNATEGAWLPIATAGTTVAALKHRKTLITAAAGNSTVTADFTDMGTTDYAVTLTPTIRSGGVAPAAFPNAYGWCVLSKTTSGIAVSFYAIPTETLEFEVDIWERPSTV